MRPYLLVAGLVLSGIPSSTATAQSPSGPAIQRAQQLMQRQQFDSAAVVLEAETSANAGNGRAWLMLGIARMRLNRLDSAVEALERATRFDAVAPNALLNLGMAYAASDDLDRAFEWLLRAKATSRVNMTNLGILPGAEKVRLDRRYRDLFPTDEEYAAPFAESVEILQEWVGESEGDQFGWIARNIGDVDGDGVNDVTTSAPSRAIDGSGNAGRVYAFSGRSGELRWTADGKPGAQLGLGIEAAGDVDADGVPDVVAGAPGVEEAYVLSGRDGAIIRTFSGEASGDTFGGEVADLGDVNGDGHADVLVGASGNDAGGDGAGRAYVYSGRDGSVLLTLTGERAGDGFGSSAGGAIQDGSLTIIVGAPNAGPANGGRAYVYHGLTTEPSFVIDADETGSQLGGMFVSVVGDVDGDGVRDAYASDWSNNAKGPSTGRIYVHSGATGERLLTLTGETSGDGFGIGSADAGDVDGDGHDDLIVGAWQHGSAAISGGKVYLFSGKDGALVREYTGKVPGETFGFDATGMGDVNGDGTIDFLLTSAWSGIRGTRSGRMFIVTGR